jgi:hypothetical protein
MLPMNHSMKGKWATYELTHEVVEVIVEALQMVNLQGWIHILVIWKVL